MHILKHPESNSIDTYGMPVLRFISLLTALVLCLPGKAALQGLSEYFPRLPLETPEKKLEFTSVDSFYFEHLGYITIPLSDGSFILYDRMNPMMLRVNEEGALVKRVAREGRGPGEIGDILFLGKTGGEEVLAVDQANQKIIRFSPDASYKNEFLVKPIAGNLVEVYPAGEPDPYINVYRTHDYLRDESKSPSLVLAQFNPEPNTHGKSIRLESRKYARLVIDGQLRGARAVPYTPDQLLAYDPTGESLYAWWTGSGTIAQLSADFDTLRTIPVQLPGESLSSDERDSLHEATGPRQWRTLKNHLPAVKTPVEAMKIDHKGRFWLQLTYRSDHQPWLVMSGDGTFEKIVHLPRGAMLTHISGRHLGVRLNAYTFALFEPVD